VLPALAPALIWLLPDQRFFNEVIVSGWKRESWFCVNNDS
jgi:hypothetical protein